MEVRGAKTVPVKDIDSKRQIAETYFISMSGKFLPIQLIYCDKTKRCLPKCDFPATSDITLENHLSKILKGHLACLTKLSFPIESSCVTDCTYTKVARY